MAGLVDNVIMILSAAGYRVGDAWSGGIMPQIQEPVTAVELTEVDTGGATASVQVTVISPLELGARACQEEAWKVCLLLQGVGAQCKIGSCSRNTKAEMILVPVTAVFFGNVLDTDWQLGTQPRVRLGTVYLQKVQAFYAWREDKEDIEGTVWRFRIEEQMDGISAQTVPEAPFTVTVTLGSGKESFGDCALTLQKRTLLSSGVQQVWEGYGQNRTVTV